MRELQKRKNDSALVKVFREGNQIAFRELYLRYHPLIKSIVLKYSPDYKDYSQAVWLIMLEKIDKFSGGNFRNWIYTITQNYCIDEFRKKKRSPVRSGGDIMDALSMQEEDYSAKEKRFIQAFKNFDSLTDLQRRVVYYRLLGYPFGKISKILRTPYGTCTPAFSAAVVKLRRGLVKDGVITDKSLPLDLRKYSAYKRNRITII